MSFRQMLPFLFLNIVVSAAVVLSLLFWWDRRDNRAVAEVPTPTAMAALGLPTPVIAEPPSGAPPPEETAPEEAQPVVHVVQAGETLGIISQRYEVTVDDIMLVNGLSNPNLISIGQQLTIPVGGIPTPTAAAPEAEEVAALPSPIPTEPAAASGEGRIELVGIVDPGMLETEAIQIINGGTSEQSIEGWTIRDEDRNVYTFGRVVIFGEGAGVLVHTRTGSDTATDLFWGLTEPLWRSGETLTLWNAGGEVVATYVVP